MRRASIVALSLAIGALQAALPPSARAWGAKGHRVVGRIAWDLLSPQARQAVTTLLQGRAGLDDIAPCADFIRRGSAACAGFQLPAVPGSSAWHFVNMDIADPGAPGDLPRYCPAGRCVVGQIGRSAAAVADASLPLAQRQLALIFLVHLVGDVHQPLHASDDGDAGGNARPVRFEGRAVKLHALWDDLVMTNGELAAVDPDALAASLEAGLARDPGTRAAGAGSIDAMSAAAAAESFQLARDVIYPRYAADGGDPAERPDGRGPQAVPPDEDVVDARPSSPVVTLDDRYQADMQPLAMRRLQLAGVRLASILEQAFAAPSLALRARPALAAASATAAALP